MAAPTSTDRQRGLLGPGLEQPALAEALVLFGSRARGEARPDSDLDLLIRDAATAAHWGGSRWHVLGPIHREGVPLHAT